MENFELIRAITGFIAACIGLITAFVSFYAYVKETDEGLSNDYLIIGLLFLILVAI